jgi:hypothetical protein
MNLRTAIISATTAAVLATSGVALAGAAGGSASSSPAPAASASASTAALPTAAAPAPARHAVIAGTVGIDRKTLRHDLLAGETIAAIASAHGVDPQTVVTALVTAATTKLDAAAQAGRITAARAHRIEQRLPDRINKLVTTWHPKRAHTTPS